MKLIELVDEWLVAEAECDKGEVTYDLVEAKITAERALISWLIEEIGLNQGDVVVLRGEYYQLATTVFDLLALKLVRFRGDVEEHGKGDSDADSSVK